MTTIPLQYASPDILHFHNMSLSVQEVEKQRLKTYLEQESPHFEGVPTIPYLEAMDSVIFHQKALELVVPQSDFGIVSPIRQRVDIPPSEEEGSMPYLVPVAHSVLRSMVSDIQSKANANGFMETLDAEGIVSFRVSITSLTRTTAYQALLVREGRLAAGIEGASSSVVHSVHETGYAYDMDHSGLYVKEGDGREYSLNPNTSESEGANGKYLRILGPFRELLREVVTVYQRDNTVIALEEVPEGWGAWHVAALPH